VPLRATLTLSLREYKTLNRQLKQLNLNSPDRSHSHISQHNDTLARLAAKYYHKPGEWRAIADGNDVDDPRRLAPGRYLTIPPIR
jgi:nucleoid-associated protein YgaU